ncbi:uncharacterized protein CMU_008220 [Cryptosporidium muris RN66]|uniref:OBG-type G domain-containing protein n=1 Tax=Cryptosporidium muris (strain RN66) TaxID=441375 RepID=B6ADP0_CRYMR|nr:uncharacterized protein CMU_008220 [Cryptosporidium muris RN66]EEA06331.1 hypothetical protein, conserved [Cryptosporidium muris RN66]|eukprot:XP_002140680.1 hypothetical protein [Cryptosporidium muris RN66]
MSLKKEYVIGCVGKPSSGKSTFFNSATDSTAKIGNYPFTTIEPNVGITYYTTKCPCKTYNVKCKPNYGMCKDGRRYIPIKILDIAGLIPGAYQGNGLGNKFLDDLRHADVLLHIIDISGTTNEKGEETLQYDPIKDHDWLCTELEMWIFNNIYTSWSAIIRKQKMGNISIFKILQSQFSGYGSNEAIITKLLDLMKLRDTTDLSLWCKEDIIFLVKIFIQVRFPFVLVLNKADKVNKNTSNNIIRIHEKYGDSCKIVVASSLAECFLKKMVKQSYIRYIEDDNDDSFSNKVTFVTSNDSGKLYNKDDEKPLKELDDKLKNRLENIKDMVLFRYGVTGIKEAINAAVELLDIIPVYPVRNIRYFTTNSNMKGVQASGSYGNIVGSSNIALQDCLLVKNGTTVRQLAKILGHDIDKNYLYAETIGCVKVADDQPLSNNLNIVKIITTKQINSV